MHKIAYVFPGQGSQSLGMLQTLAEKYAVVGDVFSEVSKAVGYDVWQLVQTGPEELLNQTEYTQVAMLAADVAVYRVLRQQGAPQAKMMAGHSLGEYPALVCANALTLADAARLVRKRGQLMQMHVPSGVGAMAAIIGLEDELVLEICQKVSDEQAQVTPANYNALGQVVIAGHLSAVQKAMALAEQYQVRMAKIIPVSVPCHCPLLKPAADEFAIDLENTPFNMPDTEVVSNVNAHPYHDASEIKKQLRSQLYQPVRWVETIQFIKKQACDLMIECGPGKVLSGLIKRIDKTIAVVPVYDEMSCEQALSAIRQISQQDMNIGTDS